jgi:hypothetical protein
MVQEVSHWPVTTEAWVSLRGICGGHSGTGRGFTSSFRFSTVSIIPPWLSVLIVCGMNSRPIGGCSSETQSHPIDMNNKKLMEIF